MPDQRLAAVASKLADIDIAMLSTQTVGGAIATRPMSNNGDVDWDGDSYYFTWEQSRLVSDITRQPKVGLGFTGEDGFWAAVAGSAEVIKDKAQFEEHWVPDLEQWFEQGIDTPGLVLVKVSAERIKYWDGEDDEEILLD